jgi:MYXO-CTERM domain-containing protein
VPCPTGAYCDPATGQCVGGPPADAGIARGGSSSDGGKFPSGGALDAPTGDDHGCGCRAAGGDTTTGTWLGLGLAALLGLGRMARRPAPAGSRAPRFRNSR